MERNIVFVAMFAALIAVLGLIPKITLAFGVPITAQSLGVMLCGTVLGAKRGGLAALLFIVLVAIGLPLLAGGRGGLGLFQSASAGFLVGFPIAAFCTGYITERWHNTDLRIVGSVASIVGGVVVLYAFGILGLMFFADMTLLAACKAMLLFIPGDMIKAVLAGLITAALYHARPQSVLSRAIA